MGGNIGLVVMGGDPCTEGCRFKSHHHILDGHFLHIIVAIIIMFVRKDEKEAGDGPF